MKVLFHYAAGPDLAARLAALPGLDIVVCPVDDSARLQRNLPDTDVLWHVLEPCTAAMIAAAPQLKLIQKIGIGVNTIDLEAAKARGIPVCNLPGTNSRAVAELTLAMMLAALRRLPRFDASMRARRVDRSAAAGWSRRTGRTRGRAGGLRCDPAIAGAGAGRDGVPGDLHRPAPVPDALGEWRSLPALLAEADVVSLHVPLTAETTHLIDAAALARMKPGAVLINTARGGLVDQAALTEALRSGHLAAAGLDVFEEEPPDFADPAVPVAQRRAVPACRLADDRHVRSQLRAGGGELPAPGGG